MLHTTQRNGSKIKRFILFLFLLLLSRNFIHITRLNIYVTMQYIYSVQLNVCVEKLEMNE